MAQRRRANDVQKLGKGVIRRALEAAAKAPDAAAFYREVGMRNPSRSYFVRYRRELHSLKAVVTFALKQERSSSSARDFHAAHAARRLRDLGFDVVHSGKADKKREQRWIRALGRPGQAEFRESLFEIYRNCPLSKCSTPHALEAAHVIPLADDGPTRKSNGILLRADLHKLFDANLVAIDPSSGKIEIADRCVQDYGNLRASARFTPVPGGPGLASFKQRWAKFEKLRHAKD